MSADELEQTFTKRELQLINNCMVYAGNDPAGLPGHNLMIIIAKLVEMNRLDYDLEVALMRKYEDED